MSEHTKGALKVAEAMWHKEYLAPWMDKDRYIKVLCGLIDEHTQAPAMLALLERCLKVLPVTMEDNHWWCSGCCTWVSCEGVTNVEECAICGTDLSCCQPNSKIYNLRDNIKTLLKEAKEVKHGKH